MNDKILKILLIEDEIAYADWIEAILVEKELNSVEIKHVTRIKDALISLSESNFDVVLLDLSLPDSQGMGSIFLVKQQTSHLPIIVLTHLNDRELALKALSNGVQDYLIKKNCTGELLIRSIHYAIERQRAESASRQQALMKKMLDRIRQSLNLEDILDNTVAEVRQFLNTDRVLIYRYQNKSSGKTIARSCKYQHNTVNNIDFLKLKITSSRFAKFQAVEDISKTSLVSIENKKDCQIRSILILTIYRNLIIEESIDTSIALSNKIDSNFLAFNLANKEHKIAAFESDISIIDDDLIEDDLIELPWGILVAYNEIIPRKWRDWEIDFLTELTTQVTIAIQQSELYSKLQDINRKLEELAILDGLTGVANRRYFDRVLINEWQRLAREQKSLSLILCDIDYFKLYNDTYGHPEGDLCLQAVAKVLKTAIERPADLVARYGGEEFAIILPDTNTHGAWVVANKMRQNIEKLKIAHEKSLVSPYVTISIGIASQIPDYHLPPQNLIDRADRLLYQSKNQGRDSIAIDDLDRAT